MAITTGTLSVVINSDGTADLTVGPSGYTVSIDNLAYTVANLWDSVMAQVTVFLLENGFGAGATADILAAMDGQEVRFVEN